MIKIFLAVLFCVLFCGDGWAQVPQCSAVSCSLNNENQAVCAVTCPDGNTYGWMPPAVTNGQGTITPSGLAPCAAVFCDTKSDGTLVCGVTCPDGYVYRMQAVDREKLPQGQNDY